MESETKIISEVRLTEAEENEIIYLFNKKGEDEGFYKVRGSTKVLVTKKEKIKEGKKGKNDCRIKTIKITLLKEVKI